MAEMSIREALDLAENWYTKSVRPFEKFRDALAVAREVEVLTERARNEATALQQKIAAMKGEIPSVADEAEKASAAIADWRERVRVARAEAEAAQIEVRVLTDQAQASTRDILAKIERTAGERQQVLDKEHAALKAWYDKEIAEREEKKRDLDAALAAIRARL